RRLLLLKYWIASAISRRIPRLVWPGDELDVRITFKSDCLSDGGTSDEAFHTFYSGALAEAQRKLREAGIEFDTGMGFEGRDWEWDFSLRGPVSVTFKRRAQHPERRVARPRPTLAFTNLGA